LFIIPLILDLSLINLNMQQL